MIVILMGVSGSGKTTIGKLLSRTLGWKFVDADDYHPPKNRKKMQQGIPLTDEDRMPWLQLLRKVMQLHQKKGESLILACSALRQSYRKKLGVDQKTIRTIYLKGSRELLAERLARRDHHDFFNPSLLDTQIATLEEPRKGLIVSVDRSPKETVAEIIKWLSGK